MTTAMTTAPLGTPVPARLPPGHWRRTWLLLLLIPVLAAAVGYSPFRFAVNGASDVPSDPMMTSHRVVALGKVEPVDGELQLALDTAGRLRQVFVDEGEWVKKDQLLAELVNDELVARQAGARHEVAHALANLTMLHNGSRKEEIDEVRAEAGEQKALLDHQLLLLKRRETLISTRAVTEEDVQEARSRVLATGKRREAVAAKLARLVAGTRAEEIEMAQATLELQKAHVEELRAALDRTRLLAPTDGRIIRLLHRQGEGVAGEAEPILVFADTRYLQVRAEVDESQVSQVCVGAVVQVKTRDKDCRECVGRVQRIADGMGRKQILTDDPREKVDTRVLEVIIALENPDGLRPSQRVDVVITVPEPPSTSSHRRRGYPAPLP
jgi:multidrug resistance efflux pump